QRLFQDALAQVELADRIGIDHAWEVEHHFLEEYSHSSAPEVFLGAASQRTRRIRLGHGIVLMPPGYNHPGRVAERLATLDLVSNGRVGWGTGGSASRAELEGLGGEARHWVEDCYETFKRECVPIGHAVNPNVAMVTGFSCHADAQEARRRGIDGFRFFQFALGHHYVFGKHRPGRTDIWEKFERVR